MISSIARRVESEMGVEGNHSVERAFAVFTQMSWKRNESNQPIIY
jgi:hypothetical protein